MSKNPKIAFIGAGSTVFMKNIVCDVLQRKALKNAHFAMMDIDPKRLNDSEIVVGKLISTLGVDASYSLHTDQKEALEGADFVITAFQVGGYDPCTITDFEVPKEFGLRQTIADTVGVGGIMRGLRTVQHLWSICDDMLEVSPEATMLQYVNPMAINIGAIVRKYPAIKVVGLCHSVQHTAHLLANDLGLEYKKLRYKCGGINHISFFLQLEELMPDGSYRDLYPDLQKGYADGTLPISKDMKRCPNIVRYEMMKRTGYYVTESSEHFSEYTPWFIKQNRPDLIEKFQIPLDEYPKRCVENIDGWKIQLEKYKSSDKIKITDSGEYASSIINSIWTDEPSVIYGNVLNNGLITSLPDNCVVEVACLVNRNGIQPTIVGELPPQLAAIMMTNINVQLLTVDALLKEDKQHVYHAAMMDPLAAANLDLDQIWEMVDKLIEQHGDYLPEWLHN